MWWDTATVDSNNVTFRGFELAITTFWSIERSIKLTSGNFWFLMYFIKSLPGNQILKQGLKKIGPFILKIGLPASRLQNQNGGTGHF